MTGVPREEGWGHRHTPRDDPGRTQERTEASGGPAGGHPGGRLGACGRRDKGCRRMSRLSEEFLRAVLPTKSHRQTPGPVSPSQPPLQATGHSLLPSPVAGQAGQPRGPGRRVGPPSHHDQPTATGLGPSVRATLCQPDQTEPGHRMAVVLPPPFGGAGIRGSRASTGSRDA